MTINLSIPSNNDTPDLKPRITVIGVGGAGGNAVNNMIQSQLEGVDFVVANTDAQSLEQSQADRRVQLGEEITQGLGAGSRPEIGKAAAEETLIELIEQMNGSNMVFIAAGMGGGTGTGAAPVIAKTAKDNGILTVGVVTKPFQFEGAHRMRIAESGIEELEQFVDTLIIIPNQNLFRVANEKTTFADAFKMADDVLYSGVRGVTDLMVMPGLINLDFADINTVMSEMGKAMMGTGEAEGERRALDAAEAAISNPLLDDTSMKGAKGVLINITGGHDMTLFEVDEAANRIRDEVDGDAYIIFGSTFDESLAGSIRVSVVSTGMNNEAGIRPVPVPIPMARPVAKPIEVEPEEAEETVPEVAEAEEAAPVFTATTFAEAEIQEELEAVEEEAAPASEESPEAAAEVIEEEAPAAEAPMGAADAVLYKPDEPETADDTSAAEAGSPPPATPSAGSEDAYIPPAPADHNGSAPAVDPFAAAAMANGAKEPEAKPQDEPAKAKAPSLFERVTGTGRAATSATVEDLHPQEAPKPAEAPKAAESAGELGSLDPADRIPASQPEDDLLDIPAFLRRQAN
ncbi:MAG: cell division protein FtsZ [Rhodospirillales bacterium]|nr:cell division protein FtsZ [Rhodospirillales bacterium]